MLPDYSRDKLAFYGAHPDLHIPRDAQLQAKKELANYFFTELVACLGIITTPIKNCVVESIDSFPITDLDAMDFLMGFDSPNVMLWVETVSKKVCCFVE